MYFKLKNIPCEVFPQGVVIKVNEKGWCNEHEMHYWINNVWNKRSELVKPQSLLVLDSFRGHLVDSVKYLFKEDNTHLAVIPGGLTSRLQPLDVSVNKSFKSKVYSIIKIFICITGKYILVMHNKTKSFVIFRFVAVMMHGCLKRFIN